MNRNDFEVVPVLSEKMLLICPRSECLFELIEIVLWF